MADGDTTGVVAAAVLLHGLQQAALGSDLGQDAVIRDGHAAAARSSGAILFDSHCAILLCLSYELLSGSYPHRGTLGGFYQTMLLKNSISLESLVRVTIAFLEAAV